MKRNPRPASPSSSSSTSHLSSSPPPPPFSFPSLKLLHCSTSPPPPTLSPPFPSSTSLLTPPLPLLHMSSPAPPPPTALFHLTPSPLYSSPNAFPSSLYPPPVVPEEELGRDGGRGLSSLPPPPRTLSLIAVVARSVPRKLIFRFVVTSS